MEGRGDHHGRGGHMGEGRGGHLGEGRGGHMGEGRGGHLGEGRGGHMGGGLDRREDREERREERQERREERRDDDGRGPHHGGLGGPGGPGGPGGHESPELRAAIENASRDRQEWQNAPDNLKPQCAEACKNSEAEVARLGGNPSMIRGHNPNHHGPGGLGHGGPGHAGPGRRDDDDKPGMMEKVKDKLPGGNKHDNDGPGHGRHEGRGDHDGRADHDGKPGMMDKIKDKVKRDN